MTTIELHPEITREGERVTYRSRIEFKPLGQILLATMRQDETKQIIWDDEDCAHPEMRLIFERGECYASERDGYAILDLFFFGPRNQEHVIRGRHDLMVPAHLSTLGEPGHTRLL